MGKIELSKPKMEILKLKKDKDTHGNCINCNRFFRKLQPEQRYCSPSCVSDHLIEKPHNEEVRQKNKEIIKF